MSNYNFIIPHIIGAPHDFRPSFTEFEDDVAVFVCLMFGDPPPVPSWTLYGATLTSSNKHFMDSFIYDDKLTTLSFLLNLKCLPGWLFMMRTETTQLTVGNTLALDTTCTEKLALQFRSTLVSSRRLCVLQTKTIGL